MSTIKFAKVLSLGLWFGHMRPHQKKVSHNLKNFWTAREKETTIGRMFYPLSAQGKCFNLATLG